MRRKRGYVASRSIARAIKPFSAADGARIMVDGLAFLASLMAAWIGLMWLASLVGLWALLVYPLVAVFAARQLRAIELIVHDASHYNFIRKRRRLNDWTANSLFAAPVGQTVGDYRRSHLLHHKRFGGAGDPCLRRMAELVRIDPLIRQRRPWVVWPGPRYIRSYYVAVAPSWRGAIAFLTWHLVIGAMAVSSAVVFAGVSPGLAASAWGLVWVIPMVLTLPLVRMGAELDEHDYFGGETEFSSTMTSVGFWRNLIFHPWNDAYHLLHHLYPDVPQTRHRRLHHLLDRIDPAYQDRRIN